MNGDKPLNILADQEEKPDLSITSKSFIEQNKNGGSTPTPLEKPQTPLQAELNQTITQVIPPKPGEKPTPTPEEPKKVLGDFKNFLQKPIRTYESDVAELMSHRHTSVASISIAETKKKEEEHKIEEANIIKGGVVPTETFEEKKTYTKQIILGFASLLLIGGGIGAGYYFYSQSPLSIPTPEPKAVTIPSIFKADVRKIILIDNLNSDKLLSEIKKSLDQELSGSDSVLEIVLGEKKGEMASLVSGSTFIKKIDLRMPDALLRSLTDRFMVGSYKDPSASRSTFLIFTTDFFQNAFGEMLDWEESMPDDLAKILQFEETARVSERNAVGTSTEIYTYFNISGRFVDKQIKNRDVREFIDRNEQLLFLYSFIDKNTLVITTTEGTLKEIIDRLNKQSYVR